MSTNPPTRPPTAAELLNDSLVRQAMEEAWVDSQPDDPMARHEEGGWIYMDTRTGLVSTRRAPAGTRSGVDLASPPTVAGSVVVGTFHTHPNPTDEGWYPGPSPLDDASAAHSGVPWLIRSDNGLYQTGPDSRRGGLTGGIGYPP
jgi:hypothetical protein